MKEQRWITTAVSCLDHFAGDTVRIDFEFAHRRESRFFVRVPHTDDYQTVIIFWCSLRWAINIIYSVVPWFIIRNLLRREWYRLCANVDFHTCRPLPWKRCGSRGCRQAEFINAGFANYEMSRGLRDVPRCLSVPDSHFPLGSVHHSKKKGGSCPTSSCYRQTCLLNCSKSICWILFTAYR